MIFQPITRLRILNLSSDEFKKKLAEKKDFVYHKFFQSTRKSLILRERCEAFNFTVVKNLRIFLREVKQNNEQLKRKIINKR